jgi:hypothetical protein
MIKWIPAALLGAAGIQILLILDLWLQAWVGLGDEWHTDAA